MGKSTKTLPELDKKPLNEEKTTSSKRPFIEEDEQESAANTDQPSERRFKRSFVFPHGTGPEEENFSEWLPPESTFASYYYMDTVELIV
ncbi:conserved hypothetical protein [Trichinella spiralis]|uniref:hypothetical protein n=1 Tax=Trichinella spiralis TaxID=6334 RepID=UPI0001EFE22B|nr:conserved hypothetical protein [Trichinella spiralis]